VLILAAAGGVLAYLLVSDGGGSGSGTGSGGSAAPPATGATLRASPFDPLGDGTENPGAVDNATDGNATTSWSTEQYVSFPDGAKNGVGLAFDLSGEFDVRKVLVDALQKGWGASIYVSERPVGELTTLDAWGPVRAEGSDLDPSHTFDTGGVKGRSMLLWLTQLPTNDSGKHFVNVAEVKVA
jgi:hypothetical protein